MKLDGMVGEDGATPREWRATFFSRQPRRWALERIRSRHPQRLVIAHGACADEDAAEVVSRGLSSLEKPWPA